MKYLVTVFMHSPGLHGVSLLGDDALVRPHARPVQCVVAACQIVHALLIWCEPSPARELIDMHFFTQPTRCATSWTAQPRALGKCMRAQVVMFTSTARPGRDWGARMVQLARCSEMLPTCERAKQQQGRAAKESNGTHDSPLP